MNKRYYILDTLKALSIIFVITTHFAWSRAQRLAFGFPFWIVMAVPIFMFVSGFVNAASMDKHGITTFREAFNAKSVVKKFIRFLVPYLVIAIAELFIHKSLHLKTVMDYVRFFMQGAKGPGGYYVTLMIQFIFVYPAIFLTMKEKPGRGMVFAFVFTFVYELFCAVNKISYTAYTQLIFRYTFVIAFGTFLYLNKKKVNILWYIASFILGVAYIVGHDYLHYESQIITMWQTTSLYGVLYIIPVIALIMHFAGQLRIVPLEWIGKRTYDIFLIQMLYYECFNKLVGQYITNTALHYIVNVAICVGVGALYYLIETPVTNWLCKKSDAIIEKHAKKVA